MAFREFVVTLIATAASIQSVFAATVGLEPRKETTMKWQGPVFAGKADHVFHVRDVDVSSLLLTTLIPPHPTMANWLTLPAGPLGPDRQSKPQVHHRSRSARRGELRPRTAGLRPPEPDCHRQHRQHRQNPDQDRLAPGLLVLAAERVPSHRMW
ncbi:hypothetical protein VTK26DRAFT_1170 [Humicola hyalothermophila]